MNEIIEEVRDGETVKGLGKMIIIHLSLQHLQLFLIQATGACLLLKEKVNIS